MRRIDVIVTGEAPDGDAYGPPEELAAYVEALIERGEPVPREYLVLLDEWRTNNDLPPMYEAMPVERFRMFEEAWPPEGFHLKGTANDHDQSSHAGGPRLKVKGNTQRNLSKKQALRSAQKVADDVARYFGATPGQTKAPETKPYITEGEVVEADYVPHARFEKNGMIVINPLDVERMADREYGVHEFRKIAHEAVHAYVSGAPYIYPGHSKTFEEGAAELLSIRYWNDRGQPYNDLDAIRPPGGRTRDLTQEPVDHLAASTIYADEVIETARRAASKVGGWDDRAAVFDEVERVMRSDDRLKWRDSTDPEFPLPPGTGHPGNYDRARTLTRFLLTGDTGPFTYDDREDEFHLKGTEHDHDQSSHAGGGHRGVRAVDLNDPELPSKMFAVAGEMTQVEKDYGPMKTAVWREQRNMKMTALERYLLGIRDQTPEALEQFEEEARLGRFADADAETKAAVSTAAELLDENERFQQVVDQWGPVPIIPVDDADGADARYIGSAVVVGFSASHVPEHDLVVHDRRLVVDGSMTGTIRHEYGHHVHVNLSADQERKWEDAYEGEVVFDETFEGPAHNAPIISSTEGWGRKNRLGVEGVERAYLNDEEGWDGSGLSLYGRTNMAEAFAESFALVTHPQYDRSTITDPDLLPMLDFMEEEIIG